MRLFKNRVETEKGLDKGNWSLWRWYDIIINGDLYLTRLTLFKTPWFSVKVHWIHKPDPDRDLHDHPWPFASFILRGWYKELECRRPDMRGIWMRFAQGPACKEVTEVADRRYPVVERLVRWFNTKDTRAAHRITSASPKLVTLVFTGPKTKEWGFYDEETFKYTDWEPYIAANQKGKM